MKQKKGQGVVLDAIVVIVLLFFFGLVAVILWPTLDNLRDDLDDDVGFQNGSVGGDILQSNTDRFPLILDNITITALVFLFISLIISVFLLDSHPIFFIFFVIMFVILGLIAGEFSNTWEDMKDAYSGEYDVSARFPISNFVFNNLLWIVIVYMAFTGVALYAKTRI